MNINENKKNIDTNNYVNNLTKNAIKIAIAWAVLMLIFVALLTKYARYW